MGEAQSEKTAREEVIRKVIKWGFSKKYVDTENARCYNTYCWRKNASRFGGIAQLGERLTGSQEVSGSIPLISTKKKQSPKGGCFFALYARF